MAFQARHSAPVTETSSSGQDFPRSADNVSSSLTVSTRVFVAVRMGIHAGLINQPQIVRLDPPQPMGISFNGRTIGLQPINLSSILSISTSFAHEADG